MVRSQAESPGVPGPSPRFPSGSCDTGEVFPACHGPSFLLLGWLWKVRWHSSDIPSCMKPSWSPQAQADSMSPSWGPPHSSFPLLGPSCKFWGLKSCHTRVLPPVPPLPKLAPIPLAILTYHLFQEAFSDCADWVRYLLDPHSCLCYRP